MYTNNKLFKQKKNSLKEVFLLLFLITISVPFCFGQTTKSFELLNNNDDNNVIMTWTKDTPETEMNDDIKALKEKGIIISYSGIKRNNNNQIIALKIDYQTNDGSKGKLELNNKKPISTITFFKQNDEIGFGQPNNNNDMLVENNLLKQLSNQDIFGQFKFNEIDQNNDSQNNDLLQQKMFGSEKSKIMIKKDGRKQLIIEDGKVIEGAEDYSQDEIDEILKNNKIEFNNQNKFNIDESQLETLKAQIQQMQKLLPQLDNDNFQDNNNSKKLSIPKSDLNDTKQEMLKAKDDMLKAKKEMENATKELEKAKSTLKLQKT